MLDIMVKEIGEKNVQYMDERGARIVPDRMLNRKSAWKDKGEMMGSND